MDGGKYFFSSLEGVWGFCWQKKKLSNQHFKDLLYHQSTFCSTPVVLLSADLFCQKKSVNLLESFKNLAWKDSQSRILNYKFVCVKV